MQNISSFFGKKNNKRLYKYLILRSITVSLYIVLTFFSGWFGKDFFVHFQYYTLNKSSITEIQMDPQSILGLNSAKYLSKCLTFSVGLLTCWELVTCWPYCWFCKILTVFFPFIWIHHQPALRLFQLFLQKFMLCLYFSDSLLAPF